MTSISAPRRAAAKPGRALSARLLAVVPLATVLAWFALVYAWQAWLVATPFIFVDELKYTQIARSIAESGAIERRGEPASIDSLIEVFTAPAWLVSDTGVAYQLAKYIGVIAMTSAAIPTYLLARMLVSRGWALFAAAGAISIPAITYSSLLLEEPFAYGIAALSFFLIARALATRSRGWLVAAAGVALIAPLVRGQLALVLAVFVLSGIAVAWSSKRAQAWRARWSRWDWAGMAVLAFGVVVVANAVVAHESFSWEAATKYNKDRMLELGLWAGGAFTIGIGIVPVLVGLAILPRPRGEPRSAARTAFIAVLGSSIAAFGFYAAVKAAYLSTVFATRALERNLIYLAPLFFVATAVWLSRPRLRLGALALSALVVLAMLVVTPIVLEYPYFEAPGYSILAAANRDLALPAATIEWLLLVVLGVALGLVLLLRATWSRTLAALVGALVLAWTVTGELYAAAGSRSAAESFVRNFPEPADWIDRETGGAETLFLGKQIVNPNGVHLLEFWNRSIVKIWSVDGTAPEPGPIVTPDLATVDGELSPDPAVPYVVADPGIDVVGEMVATGGSWRLFRVDPPLRLANSTTGIFTDGWMSAESGYSRFSTPNGAPGTMRVVVSRLGWGGTDVPGAVRVRLGKLVIGDDKQPAIGEVTAIRQWTIHSATERTFTIRTPPPPFRVEVSISPTFVPAELDPNSSDRRQLGAQVSYEFVPR